MPVDGGDRHAELVGEAAHGERVDAVQLDDAAGRVEHVVGGDGTPGPVGAAAAPAAALTWAGAEVVAGEPVAPDLLDPGPAGGEVRRPCGLRQLAQLGGRGPDLVGVGAQGSQVEPEGVGRRQASMRRDSSIGMSKKVFFSHSFVFGQVPSGVREVAAPQHVVVMPIS